MKMKIWSMALGLLLMVGTLRAQTYEEMIRKSYEQRRFAGSRRGAEGRHACRTGQ